MNQETNRLDANVEEAFTKLFKEEFKDKWPFFKGVQLLLLKGRPVSIKRILEASEVSAEEVHELLDKFGELNSAGEIVAFAGVSILPTAHSFKVNGVQIYTWCAADALIFPSFLDITAEIESKDPVTNDLITMRVNNNILEFISPESAFVSWVNDADLNDIRNSMCNRVHFFSSQVSAEKWLESNRDGTILPAAELLKRALRPTGCCD